jgi:signal transduction histidine kinase
MKETPPQILAFLGRSREQIETVLATTANPGQRAVLLAQVLHKLKPSPLHACLLRASDASALCVLDGSGHRRPAWEQWLAEELNRAREPGPAGEAMCTRPPPDLGLNGQSLIVAPIAVRQRHYGVLALATPPDPDMEAAASARALLTHWAGHLALLLYLEEQDHELHGLREERQRQAGSEHFADLISRVAHEFNNVLNNILLQIALFEQRGLAPEAHAELALIRRMGVGAATTVRRLQQFVQKQHPPPQLLDLNRAVREAVHTWEAANGVAPGSVHLEITPDLPPVLGTAADLRRLLHLLLGSAAAALAAGPAPARMTVRTERAAGPVRLHVEDAGPPVAAELLPHLFEPFALVRPGGEGWELTVCKALVRRLQASLWGDNRPEGGMEFVVEWQATRA